MNLAIASHLFSQGFHHSFEQVQSFLLENGLDGLEIILYGDYNVKTMLKETIVGHHLLYWPNWLDFWHGDEEMLLKQFEHRDHIEAYYGASDRAGMVEYLKKEFEIAKELKVAYMVFHISHVAFEEVFTFQHKYSNRQVMEASIELINEVFVGEGPMLLFENLWWPGLTYTDKDLSQWFLDQVTYQGKGYLLDIAHLMATSTSIDTVDEGIDYVHQVLDQMGDLVSEIKGIHLSKTIAGPYLRQDHSKRLSEYQNRPTYMDGFGVIYKHIKSIDSHKPFDDKRINEIIGRIKPEFLVYELIASSVEELGEMVQLQDKYID